MKKISINEIDFSARAKNVLKNLKIMDLRELALISEEEFLRTKNCGRKTLLEIRDVLQKNGLSFRMKQEYLKEIAPAFMMNSTQKEKIRSNPAFFDAFTLDTSGISARLRNAIVSLNIKTVGDLRKHFDLLTKRQGLGAKSKLELDTLVLQNTGFNDFNDIAISKHNVSTSPSFIIFLKKKFSNFAPHMHSDIAGYISDNFETIPPIFHKYAEEFMTRSLNDLSVFKMKNQPLLERWGELNLNKDLVEILKAGEPEDFATRLNDIIISQPYVSNQVYHFSKEIDLIIESGIEEYKKGKIPKHIASQLLHNEAETIDKACKTLCPTNLFLDIFSKRLFATKDDESTLQDIANSHHLTRERIRQIEKKLLIRFQNSLMNKFVKHKEILINLLEQKPLGFSINDLKDNEYFNDFFSSKTFEASTYINVIIKVKEIPVVLEHELILTDQYFETLAKNKNEIKHFLKKSIESFVPVDDLYLKLLIDRNILIHICKNELSCEIISEEILNKFANSLSQRKKIVEVIGTFDGPFNASDVVDRINSVTPSERLTEARVTSYISSIDDVWILDWGTYIRKESLLLTQALKDEIKNTCESFMKAKKAVYSFYSLANNLQSKGVKSSNISPFIIGRILCDDPRFVKAGKIRVALKAHFPHISDQTIEDNLESIFFEKKSPLSISDLRDILINDFGYAPTTVSMFLLKTPLLIRVDERFVATKEFCGLEPSQINAIQSQILGSLKESKYQILGFNKLIKKISSDFKISKLMADSIVKITANLYISPDIDTISLTSEPLEHFFSIASSETDLLIKSLQGDNGEEVLTQMVSGIRAQLNTLHIYPDDDALRNHILNLL